MNYFCWQCGNQNESKDKCATCGNTINLQKRTDLSDRKQAALNLIISYGGIDGSHHKDWVMDQVVRVLTNCEMVIETGESQDENGKYTFYYESLGESEEYKELIRKAKDGEDGPDTYSWEVGIAP